jgi:hypothetical protein
MYTSIEAALYVYRDDGGYNAARERCCGALGMSIRTGEKRKSLFSFFSFYISVAVSCYLSIPSISFLASRVSFSLRQTDLVIWTVIVVV